MALLRDKGSENGHGKRQPRPSSGEVEDSREWDGAATDGGALTSAMKSCRNLGRALSKRSRG